MSCVELLAGVGQTDPDGVERGAKTLVFDCEPGFDPSAVATVRYTGGLQSMEGETVTSPRGESGFVTECVLDDARGTDDNCRKLPVE